jgi:nucleotide-binding universal stress UspA family protein
MDHSFGPDGADRAIRSSRHRPLFIVGVDGSDSGLTALRRAAQDAAQAHAQILCVHVRPQPGMCELAACLAPGAVAVSFECRDIMEMQAWLHCVLTLDPLGRPWDFKVVSGRPDRCLRQIAVAEHGDALFVGRLPRTSWSRWFHRCPARKLARSPVCPVHVTAPSEPSIGEQETF